MWGRPAAEMILPFQDAFHGVLYLEAGSRSLPEFSSPPFPVKAGNVYVACKPGSLTPELVLRLMNRCRAGCGGTHGGPRLSSRPLLPAL